MVILPVDQGFEHGPARSFAKNPAGTIRTITSSSPSRRAAARTPRRLGFLKRGAREFAGQIPSSSS